MIIKRFTNLTEQKIESTEIELEDGTVLELKHWEASLSPRKPDIEDIEARLRFLEQVTLMMINELLPSVYGDWETLAEWAHDYGRRKRRF